MQPRVAEERPAAETVTGAHDATGSPPAAGARRPQRRRRRGTAPPWWFVLPAAALFVLVVAYPSVQGAYVSFTNWTGLGAKEFIGWDNYRRVFEDAAARDAVVHTLVIAVAVTVLQNLVGLLLALALNTRIKSRNALRVLFFAPYVVSPLVAGYLWKFMLAPDGAVNSMLGDVGLESWQQSWLGDPTLALWSVIGVVVWQFSGSAMVIYLAGLQNVPADVVDAALVDGAGPWRRFWYVTRPALAPAFTVNLMLSLVVGLKLFEQVYVMTQGGPAGSTDTISTSLYKSAFQFGEYAYGTTLGVLLTIGTATFAAVQYAMLRRQAGAGG